MKIKRFLAVLLTGIIICISMMDVSVKAAPKGSAAWPSGPKSNKLSSDSAIVMDISTGTILYEKKSHKKHYPASITKILTAMLAIENSSLSETVTFSETAIYETESNSSSAGTEVGEKMTMEQCLYAIMLASANEVCRGVAEHISGSIPNFVKAMNKRVKELGLKGTHFNNPNGLPDPKHYTTAYDMAIIARTAFQNSTFRKVCGTKQYTCAKTNKHKAKRTWLNHHQMVNAYELPKYEYQYAVGGKTGYTIVSRNTLVTFAEKDGMQLVCVIMKAGSPKAGEPNEYTDSTDLLNFGFENYKKHIVNEDNTTLNDELFNNYGSYFNAQESPIHLSSESAVILPKGVKLSKAKQKITYNRNVKLVEGDNVIGQVTYSYNGKKVGSSDIIYTKTESGNHLDEASRSMVNSEIEQIETTSQKTKQKSKRFRNLKASVTGSFGKIFSLIKDNLFTVLITLGGVFIVFAIIRLVRGYKQRNSRRLKRGSGGYRSRGARKQHAKRMREQKKRQSSFDTGRSKRRRSRRYSSSSSFSAAGSGSNKKQKRHGLQYSKQHKNTKESFGKNFFDF